MSSENYDFSVQVRDKTINFRKWKVKDKKKFVENPGTVKEALVYDCMENNQVLDDEEYKFMLMRIRDASIKNSIGWLFHCDNCDNVFEYTADLTEIMVPEFLPYGELQSGNVTFMMQPICNQAYYDNKISEAQTPEESYIFDFVLHVNSYNDNDGMTFDSLIETINNMDLDVFEDIFSQWERMRFKVQNVHDVTCTNCKTTETYEFDDLPGFFPDSWDV